MAARTDTQSPALHVSDRHDLIRVQGACQNNLKDVSVEIPKRRLTVLTGVSGSGKSSLVFGTIGAESQRLINETYGAFVQGFMPTLARPEVGVLDGLKTAIIVDQERMGANARSTVGTATDANAMLRILFSRLGQPHIGSPKAFSFNVPSVRHPVRSSGSIRMPHTGSVTMAMAPPVRRQRAGEAKPGPAVDGKRAMDSRLRHSGGGPPCKASRAWSQG
jgi:excinuclease UvrABC ATPase subunit